jgi:hypothetical protein
MSIGLFYLLAKQLPPVAEDFLIPVYVFFLSWEEQK